MAFSEYLNFNREILTISKVESIPKISSVDYQTPNNQQAGPIPHRTQVFHTPLCISALYGGHGHPPCVG